MNATITTLLLLASPVLCYVAYRCGYGWNTVNVMDPFTVTTFGQRNPDLHVWPDVDLRPGSVTVFEPSCQCVIVCDDSP